MHFLRNRCFVNNDRYLFMEYCAAFDMAYKGYISIQLDYLMFLEMLTHDF